MALTNNQKILIRYCIARKPDPDYMGQLSLSDTYALSEIQSVIPLVIKEKQDAIFILNGQISAFNIPLADETDKLNELQAAFLV